MHNNIFAGDSTKSKFVKLIYQELMKRKYVSLTDVMSIFNDRDKAYYDKHILTKETGYGELKKAFPDVIHAIESICPGSISNNGKCKKND